MTEPKTDSSRRLGIFCAMPEELESLSLALEDDNRIEAAGFHFRSGRIDGFSVVLAEAGVGKVVTALVGSLLLDRFGCRALIFSGVAGGLDPDLAIGDIVIADELVQHDYGALIAGRLKPFRPGAVPLGEARERTVFELPAGLRRSIAEAVATLELPPFDAGNGVARRPRILLGRILSGDQFINCADTRLRLRSEYHGQAVEMEGGALAQVAERFGAPCVVVRCLSDLAGADSHIDFRTFLPLAANAAATVVRRLIPVLAQA
jgi:adenosylhomocysteine nucleosidase